MAQNTLAALSSPTLTFPSSGSIDWMLLEVRGPGAFVGDLGTRAERRRAENGSEQGLGWAELAADREYVAWRLPSALSY